jgi:hypothetical protein
MLTAQPSAAVSAVMAEAKLLGLVIEQQAVGSPEQFNLRGSSSEENYRAYAREIGRESE